MSCPAGLGQFIGFKCDDRLARHTVAQRRPADLEQAVVVLVLQLGRAIERSKGCLEVTGAVQGHALDEVRPAGVAVGRDGGVGIDQRFFIAAGLDLLDGALLSGGHRLGLGPTCQPHQQQRHHAHVQSHVHRCVSRQGSF
jgi:hypothetical protein